MKDSRKNKTATVNIGGVKIGGDNPIAVQSMTNTDTRDVKSTVKQISELESAGCELVRVAVRDMNAAKKISSIKKRINIPLIADIHYDYKLAIESIKQGIDKIRINPGNIGAEWKVKEVTKSCSDKGIPVRVGVNSGSLDDKYLEKFNGPTAEAMVESLMDELGIMEDIGFNSIVVSLKSSDVKKMIEANIIFSEMRNYPVHLGVTEAGPPGIGEIYSAAGIGVLLYKKIGDTIRVSLTGNPVKEIETAYNILSAFGLRKRGVRIISCPTCGRLEINLENIVNKVRDEVKGIKKPLTVAVMGCSVNGPGEAKEADLGIAGGKNSAILFKRGEKIKKVKEDNIIEKLMEEINKMLEE